MKARKAPHVCLTEGLFEQAPVALPLAPSPSLLCFGDRAAEAAGGSATGSPHCSIFEEQLCVKKFFALGTQMRVTELANAILRQFVFRAYPQRRSDVLVTFNQVFPRAPSSLTSKDIVLALLNEMGFPLESLQQQEEEHAVSGDRFLQPRSSSFNFRLPVCTSATDTSISSMEDAGRLKKESVLEGIVRHALQQFHVRHTGRCCTQPADFSSDSSICEDFNSSGTNSRVSAIRISEKTNDMVSNALGEDISSAMRSFFTQYPPLKKQIIVISNALLMQHVWCAHALPLVASDAEIVKGSGENLSLESSLTAEVSMQRESAVKLVDLLTLQKGVHVSGEVLSELFGTRDCGAGSLLTSFGDTPITGDSHGSLDTLSGQRWTNSLGVPSLLSLYLQNQMLKHMPTSDGVLHRLNETDRDNCKPMKPLNMLDSSNNFGLSSYSQRRCSGAISTSNDSIPRTAGDGIVSVRNIEKKLRIGRGASGEIFAVPRIDDGKMVAVKRIYLTEDSQKHLEKELSVLKYCGGDAVARNNKDAHAVVRCYDAFFDGECAFIVMELMDSGSLIDAFNARSAHPFTEEECCAITFQVLHGLRFLHDTVRQLHRDLKPHNILLNRGTGSVKLTDFGLSSSTLQSMGFHQCGTYVGTLAYMSPARVDADSVYGKESDFWSLGITLLQLALGRLPFDPSLFTIASLSSHPPRLTVKSDEQANPFTSTFHDFIALLLPCQERRGSHQTKLNKMDTETNSTMSTRLNNDTHAHSATEMCSTTAEDAMPSKAVSPEIEPCNRMKENARSASGEGANLSGVKADAEQDPNALGDEEEKEMITANTLLQHVWFEEMTWERSVSILSAISLDPVPPAGGCGN